MSYLRNSLAILFLLGCSESLFPQVKEQVREQITLTEPVHKAVQKETQLTQTDSADQQKINDQLLSFLNTSGLRTYLNEHKLSLGAAAATIGAAIAGYLAFFGKKIARVPKGGAVIAGLNQAQQGLITMLNDLHQKPTGDYPGTIRRIIASLKPEQVAQVRSVLTTHYSNLVNLLDSNINVLKAMANEPATSYLLTPDSPITLRDWPFFKN